MLWVRVGLGDRLLDQPWGLVSRDPGAQGRATPPHFLLKTEDLIRVCER